MIHSKIAELSASNNLMKSAQLHSQPAPTVYLKIFVKQRRYIFLFFSKTENGFRFSFENL